MDPSTGLNLALCLLDSSLCAVGSVPRVSTGTCKCWWDVRLSGARDSQGHG